jgi:hypothetical protein
VKEEKDIGVVIDEELSFEIFSARLFCLGIL